MPRICPECKEPYDWKETASKVTIPVGGDVCNHQVEFEGDANTGVWYFHE